MDRDVVVLGGGLAGLCLGLQLRRTIPGVRVTVLERARFPRPEAAFKVGESTVEIGALYLADTLGLRDHLDAEQVRKFGLRFFFSDGHNTAIERRSEYGLTDFLPVRTWQVDRGRLENLLAARLGAQGGELVEGARVDGVDVDGVAGHVVRFSEDGVARRLTARWVIDATGRRAVLKGELKLGQRTSHEALSAWWRVPGTVDVDTWSEDRDWRAWAGGRRLASTNHLIGDGYWVWLIPLPGGQTSVGVVASEARHPASTLRTADRADAWLEAHEPQLAARLRDAGPRQDFLFLRRYTHAARRVISPDRWALVGDAGLFLDPIYSPGTDFICLANTYAVDCVRADLEGAPDAAARVEGWNRHMLRLFRTFLSTYRDAYPLLGRPEVWRAKLLWDFGFYWSGHAAVHGVGHATEALEPPSQAAMLRIVELHLAMQTLFASWGAAAPAADDGRVALDYGAVPWLRSLNAALIGGTPPSERLPGNVALLEQLAADLVQRAQARVPSLEAGVRGLPPPTGALVAALG